MAWLLATEGAAVAGPFTAMTSVTAALDQCPSTMCAVVIGHLPDGGSATIARRLVADGVPLFVLDGPIDPTPFSPLAGWPGMAGTVRAGRVDRGGGRIVRADQPARRGYARRCIHPITPPISAPTRI